MLCKYRNIFGIPNKGIHHYRIAGFALVDIILTLLLSYIIFILINKKLNFWKVLLIVFITGIILHRVFCVNTKLDTILFPTKKKNETKI